VNFPPALQIPFLVILEMGVGVSGCPDCDKILASRWMGLQI